MELMTVKQAAIKWKVSERRVQKLCSDGRVIGAIKLAGSWMIPSNSISPTKINSNILMPKKTPFLDMTNLYSEPGLLLNNKEAYVLYEAQIAYRRGELDKVYDKSKELLKFNSDTYAILGSGMLLALCAIWKGDLQLWIEAKKLVCGAPTKTKEERDIVSLTIAIIDSSLYNNQDYPEWFKNGNFEVLPADSHPAAKVYYIKYLYITAFSVASKQIEIDGISGLSMMNMIPLIIEPLITQAVVDKTIIPEIYLRLSCAVAYNNTSRKDEAIIHLDKAINLACKDRLYGILTEYVRHFNGLLEERLKEIDELGYAVVTHLYKKYNDGWSKIIGVVRNKMIATNITPKEREIAKLIVFGFTNKEISKMLNISESTVKQTLVRITNKTKIYDKKELIYII